MTKTITVKKKKQTHSFAICSINISTAGLVKLFTKPDANGLKKQVRVLSLGVGVNSIAALIKYWKEYDLVIFADTHDEHSETYEYIGRYVIPFCLQHNIPFVMVGLNISVVEGAERHTAPELFFWQKQCSRKHKIYPIIYWIRDNTGCTRKNPALIDVCFAYGEESRIGPNRYPKYAKRNFPLMDDKITRAQCNIIIREYGWENPGKSGCDHCFMAGRRNMKKLLYVNPEKVQRLADAEKNDKAYPKRSIFEGMTLQSLIDRMKSNSVIEDFFDDVDADAKDEKLQHMCSDGCGT